MSNTESAPLRERVRKNLMVNNFKYGPVSEQNLISVHPDLVRLARRVIQITPYDIGIMRSIRTEKEQLCKVASGKSTTMHSLHIEQPDGYSHAIDYIVYDKKGSDVFSLFASGLITEKQMLGYFRKTTQAWFTAAIEIGIQIEAGILWESFIDGPHIQLSKKYY